MDKKIKVKYDSPALSVFSFEADDVIATGGFFGEEDDLIRSNVNKFSIF